MSTQIAAKAQQLIRKHKKITLVILACFVCQSFTFSMPIHGRIVDGLGTPIEGAQIAVLWLVDFFNPIHSPSPGGAVRISHLTSDAQGRFHVPAAFIVHTPMLPFSWLMRTDDMPRLYVVARGHRVSVAINDRFGIDGPPNLGGFWFFRISSLRGADIQLQSLEDFVSEANIRVNTRFTEARIEIGEAQASCERRITCPTSSLHSFLNVVEQGEREFEELSKKR